MTRKVTLCPFVLLTSFLITSCTTLASLPTSQSETAISTTQSATTRGEEIARRLDAQFNDTRQNCGTANRPAFLCSGILYRGVIPSDVYDSWNPSPGSDSRGGVSFGYTRVDGKVYGMHTRFKNGFIFTPYLLLDAGNVIKPEILCSFPYDGSTGERAGIGGCGAHPNYVNESKPCDQQGIDTAEAWFRHFVIPGNVPSGWSPKHAQHQCGFNLAKAAGNAASFYQAIRATNMLSPTVRNQPHEVVVATWAQNIPAQLPIEAFFYITDGVEHAQKDQRDFFAKTGRYIPIIFVTFPTSSSPNMTFKFNKDDQDVKDPGDIDPSKTTPSVPDATGNNGTQLTIDDFYSKDTITVIVPQYQGMAAGQTIGIRWAGRVNYDSPIQTVSSVGSMTFQVPRMEVIDSIGRTVNVTFSVKRGASSPIETSKALPLQIEQQRIVLGPPSINGDYSIVTFSHPDLKPGYNNIQMRWAGPVTRDTARQSIVANGIQSIAVPAAWAAESKGHTVLINVAIGSSTGDRYLFSQVLRVKIP